MLEGDHETLVTLVEDSVSENAGSGVGATAVFGVGFKGTAEGVAAGVVFSNDHSSPDGGIPCIPVPGTPFPNDIEAV